MAQIAVVNSSKRLSDADVAFMVAACDAQVSECAAAWNIDPTPVVFYARATDLPKSNCRIMDIVDDLDEPGALGYHTDDLGVIYGRVLAQSVDATSVTLSHECLEELVDPTADKWVKMPDGRDVALEDADPVEGDSYEVEAAVLGETRKVKVSNYVLPRWFGATDSGNFDRLGKLSAPFTMTEGGYMVVRDATGDVENVFAKTRRVGRVVASVAAGGALAEKLGKPGSRLIWRIVGTGDSVTT